MGYSQSDALYDLMSVQVPLSFLTSLIITLGLYQHVQGTSMDVLVHVLIFCFIGFCFALLFFALDLIVLTPLFAILHLFTKTSDNGETPQCLLQTQRVNPSSASLAGAS